MSGMPFIWMICNGCGVAFEAEHDRRKYCTYQCFVDNGSDRRSSGSAKERHRLNNSANLQAILDDPPT